MEFDALPREKEKFDLHTATYGVIHTQVVAVRWKLRNFPHLELADQHFLAIIELDEVKCSEETLKNLESVGWVRIG
jgi:hypothetical protein